MSTQPPLPAEDRIARSLEKIARELHVMNLLTWTETSDGGRPAGGAFANTLAAHFALDRDR